MTSSPSGTLPSRCCRSFLHRALTKHHLTPCNPLRAPLGQVLVLGNQTLMNRAGQHRDAVLTHLVAELLTGHADSARTGRTQDIHIQVVPLLRGQQRAGSRHHRQASTSVLLNFSGRVKLAANRRRCGSGVRREVVGSCGSRKRRKGQRGILRSLLGKLARQVQKL